MIEKENLKIGLEEVSDFFFEMYRKATDEYKAIKAEEYCDIAEDALAMLKEQDWISVKDRLPNCNGCYLVWRPHFYPDKGMPSICYFDGQNTWHDSYGVDFARTLASDDVSHWMPLPEQPYKAVKLE